MRSSAASFHPLTAALICTSAKCAKSSTTPRTTSRPFAEQVTYLLWHGRRTRTGPDEKHFPQDFSVVLAGPRAFRSACHSRHGRYAPHTANLGCRGSSAKVLERGGRSLPDRWPDQSSRVPAQPTRHTAHSLRSVQRARQS